MKNEYQNYIVNKIRKLRIEKGYSQGKLASVIGISNGQIGNIESPKTPYKYTLSHIQQICSEFKYPIEQIFLEEDDDSKENSIINLLISKIVKYEE